MSVQLPDGSLRADEALERYLNKAMSERQKKFIVELIKPSHYDDQGYIIQWWRGFVPSNSLSCLYGLALDVSERRRAGRRRRYRHRSPRRDQRLHPAKEDHSALRGKRELWS